MNKLIFSVSSLKKTFTDGHVLTDVLKGIDCKIKEAERLAIVGPSGSGKSTFLHLLGGLDTPSAGSILVQGINWQNLSEKKRCERRNRDLGFIYQFHHLLPEFSALENTAFPLLLAKVPLPEAKERALALLSKVGLSHRAKHKPAELSGGERQRVAIARALIHRPLCVLADEPTGNLDQANAAKVFELMLELNEAFNTALIIVTHDQRLASRMDRILCIEDGLLMAQEA